MNSQTFVDVIRKVVLDAAVMGTLETLSDPPGRRPSPELRRVSDWYKTLSENDRLMLEASIAMAARSAVFGFLSVLDGARAIEGGPEKGHLVLEYRRNDRSVPLTNSSLHEML